MRKYLFLVFVIIIAIIGYNYIFKSHRDIQTEVPKITITAKELTNNFLIATKDSEKKYLNKTIVVTGNISEINQNSLILNTSVFCKFNNTINQTINNHVKIKGRLIGYDDLLEEIKLDQCSFINN